jgi:hypothetical protein
MRNRKDWDQTILQILAAYGVNPVVRCWKDSIFERIWRKKLKIE